MAISTPSTHFFFLLHHCESGIESACTARTTVSECTPGHPHRPLTGVTKADSLLQYHMMDGAAGQEYNDAILQLGTSTSFRGTAQFYLLIYLFLLQSELTLNLVSKCTRSVIKFEQKAPCSESRSFNVRTRKLKFQMPNELAELFQSFQNGRSSSYVKITFMCK